MLHNNTKFSKNLYSPGFSLKKICIYIITIISILHFFENNSKLENMNHP